MERARPLTAERSNRAVLDLALRRLIASKHKGAMIDSIAALTDLDSRVRRTSLPQVPARARTGRSTGARHPERPVGHDLVHATGSLGILNAGYAIANDAAVLTADPDFAQIATVTNPIHEYIAPSSWPVPW